MFILQYQRNNALLHSACNLKLFLFVLAQFKIYNSHFCLYLYSLYHMMIRKELQIQILRTLDNKLFKEKNQGEWKKENLKDSCLTILGSCKVVSDPNSKCYFCQGKVSLIWRFLGSENGHWRERKYFLFINFFNSGKYLWFYFIKHSQLSCNGQVQYWKAF